MCNETMDKKAGCKGCVNAFLLPLYATRQASLRLAMEYGWGREMLSSSFYFKVGLWIVDS